MRLLAEEPNYIIMTRTNSIITKSTNELNIMLIDSRIIYDQTLYFLRQSYFNSKKINLENPLIKIKTYSYNELYILVKETDEFKKSNLDGVIKQAVIKQVCDMWKSFIKATIQYRKTPKKFPGIPRIPKYLLRSNKEFNVITIDSSRIRKTDCMENELRLPKSNFKFKIPSYIDKKSIKCLRILKFYDKIKIEIVYEKSIKVKEYDNEHSIGIDMGVNNLMAITSNEQNLSWLINGRPLKSLNQFYNKKLAKLNNLKASKKIKILNRNRKNKVDNYLHWASKKVIDLCLEHHVSKIVIGKNDGWKTDANMGEKK